MSTRYKYIIYSLLTLFFFGCKKECPEDSGINYYLTVKTVDKNMIIGGDDAYVKILDLYIFDENGFFLEKITFDLISKIHLNYPNQKKITVVGWGNLLNGGVSIPTLNKSIHISDAIITLLPLESNLSGNFSIFPGDIFRGSSEFSLKTNITPDAIIGGAERVVDYILPIKRAVASIKITANGFYNQSDPQYRFIIKETPKSQKFQGPLVGENTYYSYNVIPENNNSLISPILYTFASKDHVIIEVYKGNQLIYIASKDINGDPITLYNNRLTNVLINNIGGHVTIYIIVNDWNIVEIWQDF